MARSQRKRGGGNSGIKLRDENGVVVKDRYGRPKYASGGKTPPSNFQRSLMKHRARELYADAIIKEKEEARAKELLDMMGRTLA